MRLLFLTMLVVAGCDGQHFHPCYDNHTCDDGLTCVFVRGHGSICVAGDDLQAMGGDRKWRSLLPDGGTRK